MFTYLRYKGRDFRQVFCSAGDNIFEVVTKTLLRATTTSHWNCKGNHNQIAKNKHC